MDSCQRIFAALERRIPDRVPVMEMIIDPTVVAALGFRSYDELYKKLDLDVVILNALLDYPEGAELRIPTGKSVVNAWGVTFRYTHEVVAIPVDYPLKSPKDLQHYQPPDPMLPREYLERIDQVVQRYKGKKGILASCRAVFGDSWNLRGLENYMADMLLDPDLVRRIGRMVVAYNKERCRQLIRAGVDIILLGDDYAHKTGPLMSPTAFREFILPGFTEVVQAVKSEGAYCIKHTDGNIWSIIEPIVDTGIDGIGPLEPAAGMDLYEVKRRFGDRVCVVGNVDVDLLSRGTVAEVRQATRDLIERVAPGGGYILSSGNSISSAVRPENWLAMLEVARSS